MKLTELLRGMDYQMLQGSPEACGVTGLCEDSRRIKKGDLFYCRTGQSGSGYDYLQEALQRGAAAVAGNCFSCKNRTLLRGYPVAVVQLQGSHEQAQLAERYYNFPQKKLYLVGVTGTKGKTTVCGILKHILQENGCICGLCGTNGMEIGASHKNTSHTTPELFALYEFLAEAVSGGCTHCVIEVSSIAAKQGRVDGISFDLGIFTNLYPDHISETEHDSMEEYGFWKRKFLENCKVLLLNKDDSYGRQIGQQMEPSKVFWYSAKETADGYAQELLPVTGEKMFCSSFVWCFRESETYEVVLPFPGIANVSNAVGAITAAALILPKSRKLRISLNELRIKGRFELAASINGGYVIIDYAHNEVSLGQLLQSIQAYHPHRLICLFGCGGNRSRLRREAMGRVSTAYADLTVITQDNSRQEPFEQILADILSGVSSDCAYVVIPDRREAIRYCLERIEPGDVIVLAGKGPEETQIIGEKIYPMSEKKIVEEYVESLLRESTVLPEG